MLFVIIISLRMFSVILRIRQRVFNFLGILIIYINIVEYFNSKVLIIKRFYNIQYNFDEGVVFFGFIQFIQGVGFGEYSEGWFSVFMCFFVREVVCIIVQGSFCGICRIFSFGLGNFGRRRIVGFGRIGLFFLFLLILFLQLGGSWLVLSGVLVWLCWYCF